LNCNLRSSLHRFFFSELCSMTCHFLTLNTFNIMILFSWKHFVFINEVTSWVLSKGTRVPMTFERWAVSIFCFHPCVVNTILVISLYFTFAVLLSALLFLDCTGT
jgi:hypothetical protein